MGSMDYFKRGARTFTIILGILLGIRLSVFACIDDECRIILFEEPLPNKAIHGHVIKSEEVSSESNCRMMCYMEPNRISMNVKPLHGGKYKCELNNATADESELTFLGEMNAYYLAIENPCSSSPCLNKGTCQVGFTSKGFRCVCVPGYAGANCNALSKSCSDLKRLDPKAKSGISLIDPDGDGALTPYHVTCDMRDKEGVGVTVISHDSEERTLVDGCEPPGCYSHNIHYMGATFSQLASLTRISLFCEQFIKYECRSSLFKSENNRRYAWWVSHDSRNMNHWGGATPDSDKCACGINDKCAKSGSRCNCDKNDKTWREDSGLLTKKTYLPVKQLRFGDVGGVDEQGYHTLGKFKCYGLA